MVSNIWNHKTKYQPTGDILIQTFEIELIIADTKLIYAPYRIFKSGVKLKARENAVL